MMHKNIKMNCKRKYKTHLLGRIYTNFILNDKKKYTNTLIIYSYFYTNISCNKYNVLFLTFQREQNIEETPFHTEE